MEEELTIPPQSAHSCLSVMDNERVKDASKCFKDKVEVNSAEDSPSRDDATPIKTRAQCRGPQGAVFSGKILSFGCSVCKDNCTFSPNDLLKHFRAVHRGALPTYPCDLCEFVTNEFAVLQRHRIAHRNTLVRCELCDDDVQYSLLLLTRHYIMCHSVNGQFQCDWCEFTTMDAGTFVQHIHQHNERHWKCSICRHISLNEDNHQKHVDAHSGTFPFTCSICGFGAAKSEHLKKHTASVHKEHAERREAWRYGEDGGASNLKVFLKRSGDSPESPRSSRLNTLPNPNGRVLKPELCLEHTYHITDGTLLKRDNKSKVFQSTELSSPMMLQESESSSSMDTGSHTNANGVTVLMLKNKISLPANCTTKVMGFKLVDGKKHLVLKVVPTASQELSTSSHSIVEGVCSTAVKDSTENRECSDGTVSSSHCLAVSPRSPSHIQIDRNDIMAVRVKMEEEETSICTANASPERGDVEVPTSPLLNGTTTPSDTLYPVTNESEEDGEQRLLDKVLAATMCFSDVTSVSGSPIARTSIVCGSDSSSLLSTWKVSQDTVENCKPADQLSMSNGKEELTTIHRAAGDIREKTSNRTERARTEENPPLSQPFSSACSPQSATHSSPNQEVFTFHNYSKETFNASPNTTQNGDSERSGCESSHHHNSPGPFSDEGSQIDECVASVDHPDSVLQDFNIIKVEEESIPISKKHQETNCDPNSLESFVKEHSDVIISKQLDKERVAPLSSNDSLKPSKTLRLLQLPDSNSPVLLRATENPLAMPGFKLITSSANPQINVSYMKPGAERSSATAGLTATPNCRKVGAPTLFSAFPPGMGTSTNHYLINSPGLKGPVFLSSTPHNTPPDKTAKTQPTCYLLQRSVQLAQNPSTSHLKLANTQVSLNSRPVLAMPVNSADKPNTLQSGRQAFLLRYISPPKSGLLLSNQEAKFGTQWNQTSEGSAGKVIFKIVSPSGSLLPSAAQTSSGQPLFLATRPQTQCFLVSSNKSNANASDAVKKLIHLQNTSNKDESCSLLSGMNVNLQPCEVEKPILAPRPIRPPSQRKRRRKALFDELPVTEHKARRLSSKAPVDKETTVFWNPVAKDVERTLRLSPFRSDQQIKCPRRYQPVVVLNHPDAHIPEVANIMEVISRYQGAVTKVALSQKTIQVLSQLDPPEQTSSTKGTSSQTNSPGPRPVQSSVRERFLLTMKLRKKSKKKYEVVKTFSGCSQQVFSCWFCGRLFGSQEDWIGHGQRHLMEATRDWNKLF